MNRNDNQYTYDRKKYLQSNIGGLNKSTNNEEYIRDQLEILGGQSNLTNNKNIINQNTNIIDSLLPVNNLAKSTEKNMMTQDSMKDRYDPYIDYLEKRNLSNTNTITRYNMEYINIDSSLRRTEPMAIFEATFILENNPLFFSRESSEVIIKHKNHTLNINDRISINSINSKTISLSTTASSASIDYEKAVPVYSEKLLIKLIAESITITATKKGESKKKGLAPNELDKDKSTIDPFALRNTELTVFSPVTAEIIEKEFWDIQVGNLTEVTQISFDTFKFVQNSEYMQINHTHYLPIKCYFLNNKFFNDPYLDSMDTSQLKIELVGIRGNSQSSAGGGAYFDNIPISSLNTKHSIILKNPFIDDIDYGRIRRNKFFIRLPKKYYSKLGSFVSIFPKYNFSIIYHYIAGVPINNINCGYPINSFNLQGYHTITNIAKDSYTIDLGIGSTGIVDNTNGDVLHAYTGGNQLTISKVLDVKAGYMDQNQYNIQLGKSYTNIISIRMISSEFPNSQKIIRAYGGGKNNMLYWQNEDDGAYIYSIGLESGNYNVSELISALELKIYETPRINYLVDNPPNSSTGFVKLSSSYTNHNIIKVSIDTKTDSVIFRSFKETILYKPIIAVIPEIQENTNLDPTTEIDYSITIKHPSHNLQVGDSIIINNAIIHKGIIPEIINGVHVIDEIVDSDTYNIRLNKFNLSTLRVNTGGGVNVSILSPNTFRLRFDYSDTIGKLLGFRNVGNLTSITQFKNTIINSDLYQDEPALDESGNVKILRSNAINLNGYDYLLMVCTQITTLINIGPIKNVFAKILLSEIPSQRLFNTFVQMTKLFNDPLLDLFELDFEFYTPDGYLYDFAGLNHSFTIEIIYLVDIPERSNIAATTGKIVN